MNGMLQKNRNLKLAIHASLLAGKAIMEIYDTEFEVEHKVDESPLTEADKRSNEIINSYLLPTGIPIISEENKQVAYSERKNWSKCWVVDPVDGTKEFIKRNGEFTVNIALVEKGKPILGVIYVPASKVLYYAEVRSSKAYKAKLESHEVDLEKVYSLSKILVPRTKSEDIILVGSRSHMNEETSSYINKIKNQGKTVKVVSKGSSLKFCLVAEGNADVYPRFAPTMEWDTAAGQAICNAVGVNVISKQTDKSLLYNKESLLNPFFLVSP